MTLIPFRLSKRGTPKPSVRHKTVLQANGGSRLALEPLEDRRLLTVASELIAAYNSGVQIAREQAIALADRALGTNIPLVSQSLADAVKAADKLIAPFVNDLANGLDLNGIGQQFSQPPFQLNRLSLTPDENGNLLSVTYSDTWNDEGPSLSFDDSTGFSYFDSGVQGALSGNLSATLLPITFTTTFGVDLDGGVLRFFISEGTKLTVDGLEISGSVDANLGIRNLLDVDVDGPFSGSVSGEISFNDPDVDSKIRVEQLTAPQLIVQPAVSGTISFNPELTAELPLVGPISWGGSFSASIDLGGASFNTTTTLDAPSVESITALLEPAYQAISSAVNFMGGVDLESSLPGVGKGLGETLGLPSLLTGGGLGTPGSSGFSLNVTPQTIADLIQGKTVDLIRFETSGKGRYSPLPFVVPIAAAVVPLGPIPLTATLAWNTQFDASYSYYVGMGIDTVGFYIDPGTSVSASGGVRSGLEASVSVLGILSMNVAAGVGASVSTGIGFKDPNPEDGKIYLDELMNSGSDLGSSLLNTMFARLGGQAFAFAKGTVSLLFFNWTVFDEQTTLGEFALELGGQNREAINNPNSQRALQPTPEHPEYGRAPLGDGDFDPSDIYLQNGILTLDARNGVQSDRSNIVNIAAVEGGGIEVSWRGYGQHVYHGVQSIVYEGNDQADRFFVSQNVTVPVTAYGRQGADILEVRGTGAATLVGGDDSDTLTGGSGADSLDGGMGNDRLVGNLGNDTLDGGADDDTLDGAGGHDSLSGGDGMDLLLGGAGTDTLDGGLFDDILHGGTENDSLLGGQGRDIVHGDDGDDTIRGDEGDDILLGGAGADLVYGGSGNDVIYGDGGFPNGPSTPTAGDGNDMLYGQDGDDYLFGEGGNDQLLGDDNNQFAGADRLWGGTGTDTLYGYAGADELYGDAGADLLYAGAGADTLNGGADADTLHGEAGNDVLQLDFAGVQETAVDLLFGGVDQDRLTIAGTVRTEDRIEDVDGTPTPVATLVADIDDYIEVIQLGENDFRAVSRDSGGATLASFLFTLDASLNGDIELLSIDGLGGNDRLAMTTTTSLDGKNIQLFGGTGNDTLIGSGGRDLLDGGDGDDLLQGGANDDDLRGGIGRDTLDGGAGSDIMDGGNDDDTLVAGSGPETVGQYDREAMYGGQGNDILYAGTSVFGSLLYGGIGNDTLVGGPGKDVLDGGSDNDLLFGGDLGDVLNGAEGDDTLVGEVGRDVLSGGGGHDQLWSYLNNDLRAQAGLAPTQPMTLEQINQQYDEALDEETYWRVLERPLRAIPAAQRTPAQQAQLTSIQNTLAVIRELLTDLSLDQQVTVDTLDGGSGNDTLYGSALPEFMVGGDDDDVLVYSGGQDTLRGGQGNDAFRVDGTEEDDTITITAIPDGGGNFTVTISVVNDLASVVGTTLFDRTDEQARSNEIDIEIAYASGLGGRDHMTAYFANQAVRDVVLDGGNDDDQLSVLSLQSKATLIGGAGDDTLEGGLSDDYLDGGSGEDQLSGGAGNDTLLGGAGDDWLLGGIGNDEIHGNDGRDLIQGGDGNDLLAGGSVLDRETVFVSSLVDSGQDVVFGGIGNDTLVAGDGFDALFGEEGNDTFQATSANHSFNGGPQDDIFTYFRLGRTESVWVADRAMILNRTNVEPFFHQSLESVDVQVTGNTSALLSRRNPEQRTYTGIVTRNGVSPGEAVWDAATDFGPPGTPASPWEYWQGGWGIAPYSELPWTTVPLWDANIGEYVGGEFPNSAVIYTIGTENAFQLHPSVTGTPASLKFRNVTGVPTNFLITGAITHPVPNNPAYGDGVWISMYDPQAGYWFIDQQIFGTSVPVSRVIGRPPGSYVFDVEVGMDGPGPGSNWIYDTTSAVVQVRSLDVELPPNQAPVFAAVADQAALAGETFSTQVVASDPDSGPSNLANETHRLVYWLDPSNLNNSTTLNPAPALGARINAVSGEFKWNVPIDQKPGLYTFRIGVTDHGSDAAAIFQEFRVVVSNVIITTDSAPLRGQSQLFTLSATDPDSPNPAAVYGFSVNWGDGSPIQVVNGPSGMQVSHVFGNVGTSSVSVSTTFSSGQVASFARNVQVVAARLQPNVENPALVDLVWLGSAGADSVRFDQLDATTVRLTSLQWNGANENSVETFSGITGRVIASGEAGNDVLDASGLATIQATLDGKSGNNTLYGGQAGDVLIGGSNGGEGVQGNNTIIAGNGNNTIYGNAITGAEGSTGGNNLIIGGSGNDTIYGSYASVLKKNGQDASAGSKGGRNLIVGGGGEDTIYASQTTDGAEGGNGSILISGTTSLDQLALAAVLSEWTSSRSTAIRIANISGTGTGTRLNGDNFLTTGQDGTVADDVSVDYLFSDSKGNENWLWQTLALDVTTRTKSTDSLSELM